MFTAQAKTPVWKAGGAQGHAFHLGLVIFLIYITVVPATFKFKGTISALLGCQFYISVDSLFP